MAGTDEASNVEGEETDSSGVELAYASLVMFADDGTIDKDELQTLLQIALRDGVISDQEKEVLRSLFNRIHEEDVEADVWNRVQQVRKQHGI